MIVIASPKFYSLVTVVVTDQVSQLICVWWPTCTVDRFCGPGSVPSAVQPWPFLAMQGHHTPWSSRASSSHLCKGLPLWLIWA